MFSGYARVFPDYVVAKGDQGGKYPVLSGRLVDCLVYWAQLFEVGDQ